MGTAAPALSQTAPQGALHQSAHKRQAEQPSCGYCQAGGRYVSSAGKTDDRM